QGVEAACDPCLLATRARGRPPVEVYLRRPGRPLFCSRSGRGSRERERPERSRLPGSRVGAPVAHAPGSPHRDRFREGRPARLRAGGRLGETPSANSSRATAASRSGAASGAGSHGVRRPWSPVRKTASIACSGPASSGTTAGGSAGIGAGGFWRGLARTGLSIGWAAAGSATASSARTAAGSPLSPPPKIVCDDETAAGEGGGRTGETDPGTGSGAEGAGGVTADRDRDRTAWASEASGVTLTSAVEAAREPDEGSVATTLNRWLLVLPVRGAVVGFEAVVVVVFVAVL